MPAASSTADAGTGRALASWPVPAAWRALPASGWQVSYADGSSDRHGGPSPAFVFHVKDRAAWRRLLDAGVYSAAMAFVRGDLEAEGDLPEAVRWFASACRGCWRDRLWGWLASAGPHRLESWFQTRARAARNISLHYGRARDFYAQFLDRRMVYSCAYFASPAMTLDEAQEAKLDLICRKLDLRRGESFFDIGCGWGALLEHAATRYGAQASGCTLSAEQAAYARLRLASCGAQVLEADFRDCTGQFAKIASVGMFEHVGRRRLRGYFAKAADLLEPGGLFLNHGIVRPATARDDAQTLFIQRQVFPGGEIPPLADAVRAAEEAGLEILDLEDLRPHYALTCRAWVQRLRQNRDACVRAAGEAAFRTWLLYLAGSAASFEDGSLNVVQMLLAKRSSRLRRMTRDYMSAPAAGA